MCVVVVIGFFVFRCVCKICALLQFEWSKIYGRIGRCQLNMAHTRDVVVYVDPVTLFGLNHTFADILKLMDWREFDPSVFFEKDTFAMHAESHLMPNIIIPCFPSQKTIRRGLKSLKGRDRIRNPHFWPMIDPSSRTSNEDQ